MNVDVKPVNTCCDKCEGICLNIDSKFVRDVLYAGKVLLAENSLKKIAFIRHGYVKGILCKDKELSLSRNIELLEKYLFYNKIKDFQKCLCDNEISQLIDNILGIADISCCNNSDRSDLIIDSSGYNQWVLENPGCMVYESWEAAFFGICTKFHFENIFLQEQPKLIYDLSVSNIKNKCDLIAAISIQNDDKTECNLDYGIEVVNSEKCELDYKLLVSENNCNITFDTYIKLRNCGIKAAAISKLVKCDVIIEPNITRNSCDITMESGVKITLCDYKFNINSENINCELASTILGVELCR